MKKIFTLMTIVISFAVISCKQVESELESENDIVEETEVSDSLILVKNLNSLLDDEDIEEKIKQGVLKGFEVEVNYIEDEKFLKYTLTEDNYTFMINKNKLILTSSNLNDNTTFDIIDIDEFKNTYIFIFEIYNDETFGIDKEGVFYKIDKKNLTSEPVNRRRIIKDEFETTVIIDTVEINYFWQYLDLTDWRNVVYNTDLAYVINE